MALIMHRLLEKELGKAGPNLSAERITEALSEARLQELVLGEKETYYAKSNTEGDFEAVAKAVGLGVLPREATPPQLRSALKLNIGPTKKKQPPRLVLTGFVQICAVKVARHSDIPDWVVSGHGNCALV